jgi:type IV secretion system protein VirB6
MSGPCVAPGTGGAFLSGVLNFVDCQAQSLGASGYQALASPASSVSLALTALLTICVALLGFRMLFGSMPSTGETVVTAIKIGIVLALATSWAAYRVIAYDLVLHAPAELVEAVGRPAGLPGSDGGLVGRLQGLDRGVLALIETGTGRLDVASVAQAGASSVRTPVGDDFALGFARVAYLAGTIGALAFVRLIAGLLLALAPFFAGLLLFEATRAFFMGWLRMLAASALGALTVSIILAVELSIAEPWLSNVLALRAARYATPAAPVELLVMTLAFSALLIGAIFVGVKIAFNTVVARAVLVPARGLAETTAQAFGGQSRADQEKRDQAREMSRAYGVAQGMASAQRREMALSEAMPSRRSVGVAEASNASRARDDVPQAIVRFGQGHKRTAQRVSAASAQRSQRI